ncbi:MAG: ribonuclease J [Actinomycetota bacterium]
MADASRPLLRPTGAPQPLTRPPDPEVPVRVVFLGGLGEIGRNCMAIEQGRTDDPDRTIVLIDCGLMFPEANMHGIDLILPDFTYLREHAEQLAGIVITHGHEDHIGAIQYLLRDVDGIGDLRSEPLPVWGSALSLGIARNRIEEAGLMKRIDMRPVTDGEQIQVGSGIGELVVEFIPVTHSVPHAHSIAVQTSQGVVLHSGDFKIDLTPVDERRADLARIGQLSKTAGIRLLMSDSTNAEEPGFAPSESSVGGVLRRLFAEHRDRRIITASFASHLHRIQQIATAAIEDGRKVATLGLSMRKNVRLGLDLGVLNLPESSIIDIEDIDRYEPNQICVISTGSQGEPMSALGLMARGENRFMKIGEHDTIVLSSHAIPGNEGNVNKVMDGLLRLGADVVHSGIMDVHATGHAQADDIKTYLSIVNPEWFVPIHGEYRHMVANANLAELMGVRRDHIVQCEDGDVIELSADGLQPVGRVPAGYLYVDGIIGDVGAGVLRDRQKLAEEGVVVVVASVDIQTGKVLTGPDIITRGWVYAPEAEDLLDEACDTVEAALEKALAEGVKDVDRLEREMRRATGKFVNERTRRRPQIVPALMEV